MTYDEAKEKKQNLGETYQKDAKEYKVIIAPASQTDFADILERTQSNVDQKPEGDEFKVMAVRKHETGLDWFEIA
ncbi:hypothetical protein GYB22_03130 [bacterium]|nr:hypothetical protein [bacterium]